MIKVDRLIAVASCARAPRHCLCLSTSGLGCGSIPKGWEGRGEAGLFVSGIAFIPCAAYCNVTMLNTHLEIYYKKLRSISKLCVLRIKFSKFYRRNCTLNRMVKNRRDEKDEDGRLYFRNWQNYNSKSANPAKL